MAQIDTPNRYAEISWTVNDIITTTRGHEGDTKGIVDKSEEQNIRIYWTYPENINQEKLSERAERFLNGQVGQVPPSPRR